MRIKDMPSPKAVREFRLGVLRRLIAVLVDGPRDRHDGLCENVPGLVAVRDNRGDTVAFPVPGAEFYCNPDAYACCPLYSNQYGQNRFRWGMEQVRLLMQELDWPLGVDLLPLRLRALQVIGLKQPDYGICHNVTLSLTEPQYKASRSECLHGVQSAALLRRWRGGYTYPVRLPGDTTEQAQRRYNTGSAADMWGDGEYADARWELVGRLLADMGHSAINPWTGTTVLVRNAMKEAL